MALEYTLGDDGVGGWREPTGGGSQPGVLVATKHVTSTELLNMVPTGAPGKGAVVLVPSAGPGTTLVPVAATAQLAWGTVAYTDSGGRGLLISSDNTDPAVMGPSDFLTLPSFFITHDGGDAFMFMAPNSDVGYPNRKDDASLWLYNPSNTEMADGDSALDITILYYVVTIT